MSRVVAVVFAPDYAAELGKLAFRNPVWMADTPQNRAAAEEAWQAAIEWPHISVTLFREPGQHATKDDWRSLLEQISYREGAVDAIEVIGAPLSLVARAALIELGYGRFEQTTTGFRARRG